MKNLVIFTFLLTISCNYNQTRINDQEDPCKNFYDENLKMTVYSYVDKMPEYPGGVSELMKFIRNNLEYKKQETYQGSINCYFVIDKEGELLDVGIYEKNNKKHTQMEQEVIRVLIMMPKWSAGECDNKKVPVRMILPIKF